VDELAVRHRDCNFIIAHFGFPYFAETANVVSKNPNVYTDISAALTDLPPDEAKALFDQFVLDIERAFAFYPDVRKKTLFGTDYAGEHTYLNQVEPYFRAVQRLFPDPVLRDRVTGGLAQELFFTA
jgi:predicted TIM-barrel fold metal-dependent hydrolase